MSFDFSNAITLWTGMRIRKNMNDKFIKISQVPRLITVSKATLYRWIETEMFMPPIALGPNHKVYLRTEIDMFLNGVIANKNRKELVAEILQCRADYRKF
jgi:predicted DNA-binding transcriptional regulator AlpA